MLANNWFPSANAVGVWTVGSAVKFRVRFWLKQFRCIFSLNKCL